METTRAVIDTDILIDLLRNVEEIVSFIGEIEEKKMVLSTTIINSFELFQGAYRSKRREENVSATRRLLDRLILLTISPRSAEAAGRICAELEEKGQPIGSRDALVAAVSLTKGYAVITRNAKHFRRISGLTVIAAP